MPLGNKLLGCLGLGWSLEIVSFTLGGRGSYDELLWTVALARFGLQGSTIADMMAEFMSLCLEELT